VTNEQRAHQIKALIHERDVFLKHGNAERAAEVTEELRKIGHEAEAPAKRAEKRPATRAKKPETR